MEIRRVPISEVEVWEKNPRNIKTKDFERLKRQIQELGVYKPLICVKENGKYTTLGGNMRLRALLALNFREVDVSLVDATDEATKIKYALSDNDRVGIYEEEKLAELVYPHIEEINLEDYKLDVGEPISLKDVIEDYAPDIDGEDEVPEIDDSPAITKMGDLFTLGKHRLLCGDATKEESVKRLVAGKKATLTIADPPYNVNYDYVSIDDNKNQIDYEKWCKQWLSIMQLNSQMQIVTPGKANEYIYKPKEWLVWFKRFGTSRGHFFKAMVTEPILLFGNKPIGKFYPTDHFDFITDRIEGLRNLHSCPKPIGLWCELIKPMTEVGELILDPFLGSGTTLIACEKLNRICYGMEIEPKYCDLAITRYSNFTNIPEKKIRATRQ